MPNGEEELLENERLLDEPLEEEQFESDDIVEGNPDDLMEPFNPSLIDIAVTPVSLDSLIQRMEHAEIELNTDFQRSAELWTHSKMSRLIESILIRLPLPAFYFDASDDEKWLIVDGLQRLSAIRRFVLDKKTPLRLGGLEFLSKELKGKTYDELPRLYKRRIKECQVTTYQIRPSTPPDVKYSIFQRINTGGLMLNNQEIRHAMAKTREREFLKGCANNEYLIKTMGDQSRRMKNQELVLRFFAFAQHDYETSKKNIAAFLNDMMEELKRKTDDELASMSIFFSEAMKRCYSLLGETAFVKTLNGSSRQKRKSSTLFEAWSVRLAELDVESYQALLLKKEQLQQGSLLLLEHDEEFVNSLTYNTQKAENVIIRHSKVVTLIYDSLVENL